MLALLTHQFPELMGVFAKAVSICQEGDLRMDRESSMREMGACHAVMVTRLQRSFAHCLILIIISRIKELMVK